MATNLSAKVANAIRDASLGRAANRLRNMGVSNSQISNSIAAAIAGAGGNEGNVIASVFKNAVTMGDLTPMNQTIPLPAGWAKAGRLKFLGKDTTVQLYRFGNKPQLFVRIHRGDDTGKFVKGFNGWTIVGNELVWKKGVPVPEIKTQNGANRFAQAMQQATGGRSGSPEPNINIMQAHFNWLKIANNKTEEEALNTLMKFSKINRETAKKRYNAAMNWHRRQPPRVPSYLQGLGEFNNGVEKRPPRTLFPNSMQNFVNENLKQRQAPQAPASVGGGLAGGAAKRIPRTLFPNENLKQRPPLAPAPSLNAFEGIPPASPNVKAAAARRAAAAEAETKRRRNAAQRAANAAAEAQKRAQTAEGTNNNIARAQENARRARQAAREANAAYEEARRAEENAKRNAKQMPPSHFGIPPSNSESNNGGPPSSVGTPGSVSNGGGPPSSVGTQSNNGRPPNGGPPNGGPPNGGPPNGGPPANNGGPPANNGGPPGSNLNKFPKFIAANNNFGKLSFKYIATANGHKNAKTAYKKVKNLFEKQGYYRIWNKGNGANLPNLKNYINVPNLGGNVNYVFAKGRNGRIGYYRFDAVPFTGGGNGGNGGNGGGGGGGGGRRPGWFSGIFGRRGRRNEENGGSILRRMLGNYGNEEREYYRQEMARARNSRMRWNRGGSRQAEAPRSRSGESAALENELRRLEQAKRTPPRAPRGSEQTPSTSQKIAEKFASMMSVNEKKAVNNIGGSDAIKKLFANAGGPIAVAKATETMKRFPNKAVAVQMGANTRAVNLIQKLGGPNKANLILSANHKLNIATTTVRRRRAKAKAKKAEATRADKVRATLLKAMVKKFTKNELVKLAGKNALGENNNKKKNNLVKNFTKYVRRLPKKRRSVAGPKPRKTK